MILRFYFVTPRFQESENLTHPDHEPYLTNCYQGIYQAEEELFGNFNTNNFDDFLAYNSESAEAELLKVKQTPAFVVYDPERELALFKLERKDISTENVKAICKIAWKLLPDPSSGQVYINEDGEKFSLKRLQDSKPCTSSMPSFLQKTLCKGGLTRRSVFRSPLALIGILTLIITLLLTWRLFK